MRVVSPDMDGVIESPPPAPVPFDPPAAPAAPPPPAAAPSGGLAAVNANGETLEQAEAAVLALVAGGMLGATALALHPLPPGTSTATALNFLASLPQTTYQFDTGAGVVTGPPIDTLPGFIPYDDADYPDDEGDEASDDEYADWDDYVDLLESLNGAPV